MVDNSNSKHINHINQLLHNKGIKQEDRIGVLTSLFERRKSLAVGTAAGIDPRFSDIMDAINAIDFTNKEISQEIFMLFGSKLTRYKLDQFYTPLTISEFITGMMIPGKAAVDPAGGTGDLLVHYNGNIHIWDVDEHALELCRFNYELNMKKNYQIKCANSLAIIGDHDNAATATATATATAAATAAFDYVTMNPPFGSSTVVTDNAILRHYELGVGRKKQEIGILFLELGLKLLKPDGILFAIVPAGYVGNSTKPCMDLRGLLLRHRVIASIELPKQSFKRSGTGVNTYIIVIQKKVPAPTPSPSPTPSTPYPIFISAIDNIGYELSKANTPIKYKIVRETGELHMQDGRPVVENDLVECAEQLTRFARDEDIPNTVHRAADADADADAYADADADTLVYDTVLSSSLQDMILDVNRYSRKYRSLIAKLKSTPGCATISDLAKLIVKPTKIDNSKMYKYIDIGEISTPLYGSKELYGWELPSRAKYSLQKYDILVSKLEGTVSYCVILDDSPNYISTNGVSVIRPKNMDALYVLFANITKKEFIVQHNAYLTGSIMASLGDSDIAGILMDTNVDVDMTKKMVEALTALNALRL
jgi:predicted RNA methylase